MLSCLYFVLTVTGLSLSHTESRKTSFPEDICNTNCTCKDHQNIPSNLVINCKNKGFTTFRQFRAPPGKISQILLNGNVLPRIETNEFINYGNVTSLDLENNSLQEIRPGAFNGLSFLKKLDLNYNNLEVIQNDTLVELEGLEYLYIDDNFIRTIEPGAFRKQENLKILTLMHNRLSFLPHNIFHFTPLIHLDLRGNRLNMLPLAGVLEDMSGIAMIQLQWNPWNCTCPILALKDWMEWLNMNIENLTCNSPSQHAGRVMQWLSDEAICPKPSEVPPPQNIPPTKSLTSVSTTTPPPQNAPPTKSLTSVSTTTPPPQNAPPTKSLTSISTTTPPPQNAPPTKTLTSVSTTTPPPQNAPPTKTPTSVSTTTPVYKPEPRPKDLFSALILSLVIIFILSVCVITAVFKLVLKTCRGAEHVPTGASNLDPVNPYPTSVQVQNDSDTPEPRQDTSSESHVCNDPPPPCSMCQNPVYMQKAGEQAPYHRNLKEFSFGPRDARKQDVLTCSQGASTITTKALIEKYPPSYGLTPPEPPETLYETMGVRSNQELPGSAGAPPAPLLPRKLKAEPYHQQVLENQTVMTLV